MERFQGRVYRLGGTFADMYAIVKTGGKQYTVRKDDIIDVERLDVPAGEKVRLENVLFVSDGEKQVVGTPMVEGARVRGKVLRHALGRKIVGLTYKPKKNIRRRFGHRQPYTQVLIEKIEYAKEKREATKGDRRKATRSKKQRVVEEA